MSKNKLSSLALALTESSMGEYFDSTRAKAEQLATDLARRSLDAQSSKSTRKEWAEIFELAADALSCIKSRDTGGACLTFFWLGYTTKQLTGLSPEETEIMVQLIDAERKRRAPLKQRELMSLILKTFAQQEAKELWAADDAKEQRLGDIADVIHKEIERRISAEFPEAEKEIALKVLPKKPAGIRPWLRPVAPAYATKPGRPAKD